MPGLSPRQACDTPIMQRMAHHESLARLHYELIKGLIEQGTSPSISVLAERLGTNEADVEALLSELASIHGLVLHPHVREPWIVHPFSLTPTINWITAETGSWWAPCIWCALGVAVLVAGSTHIHTRYGAEAEPLVIEVINGQPSRKISLSILQFHQRVRGTTSITTARSFYRSIRLSTFEIGASDMGGHGRSSSCANRRGSCSSLVWISREPALAQVDR